jgi:hypothetical protein
MFLLSVTVTIAASGSTKSMESSTMSDVIIERLILLSNYYCTPPPFLTSFVAWTSSSAARHRRPLSSHHPPPTTCTRHVVRLFVSAYCALSLPPAANSRIIEQRWRPLRWDVEFSNVSILLFQFCLTQKWDQCLPQRENCAKPRRKLIADSVLRLMVRGREHSTTGSGQTIVLLVYSRVP